MEFLGFAFLVAFLIWIFPLILAAAGVILCLLMAALLWSYEQITSPFKKKTK